MFDLTDQRWKNKKSEVIAKESVVTSEWHCDSERSFEVAKNGSSRLSVYHYINVCSTVYRPNTQFLFPGPLISDCCFYMSLNDRPYDVTRCCSDTTVDVYICSFYLKSQIWYKHLPLLRLEHSYAIIARLGSRNSLCSCVPLSVTRVHCDKTKWCPADILIPHETCNHSATLAWSTVNGRRPSVWNLRSKWPNPFEKRRLRQISPYNVSSVRDSEKKFNYDEYLKSTTGFPTSHR